MKNLRIIAVTIALNDFGASGHDRTQAAASVGEHQLGPLLEGIDRRRLQQLLSLLRRVSTVTTSQEGGSALDMVIGGWSWLGPGCLSHRWVLPFVLVARLLADYGSKSATSAGPAPESRELLLAQHRR